MHWIKRAIKKILKICIRIFLTVIVPVVKKIRKKKVVILMDRRNAAGDNAEAMYHYLRKQKDCRAYYILDSGSKDWERLKSDSHVIDVNSKKYVWIYIMTDVVMYSYDIYYPQRYLFMLDLANYKKVWLQHGIMQGDLSELYHATDEDDMVIVATKAEYKDRLRSEYGYARENVFLAGMPRYDYLYKNDNKIITIALTWRRYLRPVELSEFLSSNYYSMIEDLIVNPQLADLAEKFGYRIQFVPHPEIKRKVIQHLEQVVDKRITINTSDLYKNIISESSMLITDYSSISFDCAYLYKPVVYYQKDEEEFFSGNHTCGRGYFDYERDGFGEVVREKQGLFSSFESVLVSNCVMSEKYMNRVKSTFEFMDCNNCERVWNMVKTKLKSR